ncbi:MAG: hypothetical protein WCS72_18890 [Deltaproteobacteria bacterium]
MEGRLERLLRMMRSSLTPEQLPPPPPPIPAQPRPSRLRTLLGPEPLPEAPPAPARQGKSMLAALLARETLPLDPERRRPHRNWLAFLFAPERIDPPGGSGPEVH